jgi:hypothetical protein
VSALGRPKPSQARMCTSRPGQRARSRVCFVLFFCFFSNACVFNLETNSGTFVRNSRGNLAVSHRFLAPASRKLPYKYPPHIPHNPSSMPPGCSEISRRSSSQPPPLELGFELEPRSPVAPSLPFSSLPFPSLYRATSRPRFPFTEPYKGGIARRSLRTIAASIRRLSPNRDAGELPKTSTVITVARFPPSTVPCLPRPP